MLVGSISCHRMLTPLAPQNVYLTVTKNKFQLMNLIQEYFRQNKKLLSQNGKCLVVTGSWSTPSEICNDQEEKQHDFRTTHEEANAIIFQQVVHLTHKGKTSIHVIDDDTNFFFGDT